MRHTVLLILTLVLACGLARAQDSLIVIPHKPDPPIAVDGNLSDWATVPNAIEVRGKEHVTYNPATWKGPDDLGATIHLAWRTEGLYLAADVTDDILLQQGRDEKIYAGDHIEWFIDLAPDVEPARTTFAKGQFQFALSPGNFKRTGDRLVDIAPEVYCYQPKGMDTSSAKLAAVKTARGWIVEALVPFALMGFNAPAQNVPLATQVALSDCDSTEPAQETYMTISTKPWYYSRLSMVPAVLGDVAGHGTPPPTTIKIADEIVVKPGETKEVAVPAVEVPKGKEAYLFFKARLPYDKPAGYNNALRLWLNGAGLGAERVTNRPAQSLRNNGMVHPFITGEGTIYVPYGPDFTATDSNPDYGLQGGVKAHEWEMRVTDLLKPAGGTLKLSNNTDGNVKLDLILGQVELRLKSPPPPPVARRPAPTGPLPVREPRQWPTLYSKLAVSGDKISFTAGGEQFVVASRFSTPDGQWVTGSNKFFDYARTVAPKGSHLLVRETFKNLTNEPLPLMQRHSCNLAGRVKKVWCAGTSPASGNISMSDPENPTSFAALAKCGIGLMPLNDEFQVHILNSALDGALGLADNTYVLKPGGSYTAEWAIIPTDRPDFWDFVNACRRIRKVNFKLDQMFAFLTPTPEMQPRLTDEGLTKFIRLKSANVVCSGIEYPRYKGMYAHGTVLQELDLSVHATHNDRVRRLTPGVKTEFYFHCFLDVGDDAAVKYAADRTLLADGTQATYGEPYDRIFLPTLDNQFGQDIGKIIDIIFERCKADGVYWDEMAYSRYQYHYGNPWDGCSGDIDSQTGKLIRLKSSVTLVSQPFVVYHIKRIMAHGPLMANGAPHTRTIADLHFETFVETAAISNCLKAILYSPVALGDHISERKEIDAYRWMTDALNYGCLYSWYDYHVWPEYETLTKYMFPTTPIELHEGYIIGQERIVTNRSGLFGWGDKSKHEVHVFDDTGREVPKFKAPTVTKGGRTYTELRIAEGWTAAIVRH